MDDKTSPTISPAQPGDLCTCGRQAVSVIHTVDYGDVGHCGQDGAAFRPVLPCPWCKATEGHRQPWGDPVRCPNYTLRPKPEEAPQAP